METAKPVTEYGHFAALDLRVGKIVTVEDSRTTKPTYRITVDFGPEIGTRVSCGAYRAYTKEELVGRFIIGAVNFPVKQMGPERSEVLILGVDDADGVVRFLTPERDAPIGAHVY